MKNKLFAVGIMACTIMACKKETQTMEVKVIDQVTNTPVANARVVVYKCGAFNCYLGSIDLFSGNTDNNGVCKVPVNSYNEGAYARVEKSNYFSFDETKSTSKSIVPAGWMRIRINSTIHYTDQSSLHFFITSQSVNSAGSAFQITTSVNVATDSSILIKGFGGQVNKIDWQVQGQTGIHKTGNWSQQVPRLDTAQGIILNY